MTLNEKLLRVSDLYCLNAQLSRARVSTLIFGGGSRLGGVAKGRDLNTRNWEKAMAWFSSNWPEGLEWPEGVERPAAALPLTPTLSPAGRGGDAAPNHSPDADKMVEATP